MLAHQLPASFSTQDQLVLTDIVRFGALATDQVARRYDLTPADAALPLEQLRSNGMVDRLPPWLANTDVWSATRFGARVVKLGLSALKVTPITVRHDLALVDLADHVWAREPYTDWETEREVMRAARAAARGGDHRATPHRPDGALLLDGGERIGIELELRWKGPEKYARVCRWYAEQVDFSGLRWYVSPAVGTERIERIVDDHGLAQDLAVTVLPLPAAVRVRAWAS